MEDELKECEGCGCLAELNVMDYCFDCEMNACIAGNITPIN